MPRRLIEEAFPLKKVSEDSKHEKKVNHGHISSLHVWPARRPLAACRAATIATLLPDPADAPPKMKEEYARLSGSPLPEKQREYLCNDLIAALTRCLNLDEKPDLKSGDLADHVRLWGQWVLKNARKELLKYYPVIDTDDVGEPTMSGATATCPFCESQQPGDYIKRCGHEGNLKAQMTTKVPAKDRFWRRSSITNRANRAVRFRLEDSLRGKPNSSSHLRICCQNRLEANLQS